MKIDRIYNAVRHDCGLLLRCGVVAAGGNMSTDWNAAVSPSGILGLEGISCSVGDWVVHMCTKGPEMSTTV